jgi:hypothetical protein
MKHVFFAVIAVAFLVGSAAAGSAAKSSKKHRYYANQHARLDSRHNEYDRRHERQKEYDVNKLPFGSHDWWEQMARESRTVCCN